MPESAVKPERSIESSGSWFRLRYNLAAMLVLVALIAGGLGWVYIRPARALVSFEIRTIRTADMDAVGWAWENVPDSPYRWALAKEMELPRHVGKLAPWKWSSMIKQWPGEDHLTGYGQSMFVTHDGAPQSMEESGLLDGVCGVRAVAGTLQFRIDDELQFLYPDQDALSQAGKHHFDEVRGRVRYEGDAPEECLVFAAPIRNGVQQLVIVRVRKMKSL